MPENLREIVNGAQLPQFINQKVSLTGLITNVNPNGLSFDVRSTDDVLIKVNLKRPNRNVLEGYVEVHGTAQNKAIICDEMVLFSQDGSKDFDTASHNTLCNLLHSVPQLWVTDD
ncbi:replication protein A 14 kDa subunit-like [Onthophagus taurus]|uniref:replication protein A 14 kDa subunit-like n=1 Tax=Onthophagus taurus TaxID=166361 RepID=UPI000C2086B7|nr:uncharacterized protein LOC111426898 [Onthophagus taurus]